MTLKETNKQINKINKILARPLKKKDQAQIINGRNVWGVSSIVPTNSKRIIRRHYEQFDANKFGNLDQMDKSLERQMTKALTRNR